MASHGTLIVTLGCTDGIVMGADSASTDASSGTKQAVVKIQQIGKHPILFGGSGDVGLIKRILDELNSATFATTAKFKDTRRVIKDAVLPHMKEAREDHIPQPVQGFNMPPTATLMFGCIQHKVPFVLEVEIDGRDTVYDKDYGSFNAIGSGKGLAQAIMRPHLLRPRDLRLGKTLAYRVLEDSIELAAAGLAMPIHLFTLDLHGVITELDDTELNKLKSECELWRELEREALGQMLAPPSASEKETKTEIPEPETEQAAP